MELPPPVEQAPEPSLSPETNQQLPEQVNPAGQERQPSAHSPAQAMPSLPMPMPTYVLPQQQTSATSSTTPSAGLTASDDSDLIEKEWVSKAKQIVERTRDDPYKQSEELTVVKVDYMKKRYNKTIKLNK